MSTKTEVVPPTAWKEREFRFESQMTDAEALMWNVEKDPWLNPSGATVSIVDRPIDFDQLRRRLAWAVAKVPRLRERVVPAVGRLAPPQWRTDPEFDFEYHLRHIALPAPGSQRQLFDLATLLYQDPFDRTRPLWMFVVIDGLEDGRGAVFWKMHHSITDGLGAVRLSELYMELEREAEDPPAVDLDEVLAVALAEEASGDEVDLDSPAAQVRSIGDSLGHLVRRQAGLTRRILGEAAIWPADPVRPVEQAQSLVETATNALDELFGRGQEESGGSPLWKARSRGRHLEGLSVDLDTALATARELGGTLNDLLLAVVAEAAHRYHKDHGVELELVNTTFVISTRDDEGEAGGNAFSPTRAQLPAGPMSFAERFLAVHNIVADKRASVSDHNALASLAAVGSRLPTSVVSRLGRQQAASIEVATSNFRAAPFTVYISGAELQENYVLGPVAGTACNLTAMSYDGTLWIGVVTDPAAIADPVVWRDHIERAFADVLEA